MEHTSDSYYVPDQSIWPIVGAIAMFLMLGGTGLVLNDLQNAEHASQSSSLIMYSGMVGSVMLSLNHVAVPILLKLISRSVTACHGLSFQK